MKNNRLNTNWIQGFILVLDADTTDHKEKLEYSSRSNDERRIDGNVGIYNILPLRYVFSENRAENPSGKKNEKQ